MQQEPQEAVDEKTKLLEKALEDLSLDVKSAPSCFGGPSFSAMAGRRRRYLDVLVKMQDVKALQAFRDTMKSGERATVERPYSPPEDRYEDMANDYGSDLKSYYRDGRREADNALATVKKEMEHGRPPQIKHDELEALKRRRCEEAEERKQQAEKAKRAKEAEQEAQAAQRQNAVKKILDCMLGKQGEEQALRKVLDECAAESSTWIASRSFLAEIGPMVLNGAAGKAGEGPASLLAVFVGHPLCVAGSQLADYFWKLCASGPSAGDREKPLRRALALRFASEEPGAGEGELAHTQDTSADNVLLLWACYKGNVGVVAALMDAYAGKIGKDELCLRLQTRLLNKAGLNALHMAARVSDPGRKNCHRICQLLAPFIDPARKSKEGNDVMDYLKLNQSSDMIKEISELIRSVRRKAGDRGTRILGQVGSAVAGVAPD